MPVQKGKKHKRSRQRGRSLLRDEREDSATQRRANPVRPAPPRRTAWPPWVGWVIGPFMLLAGVFFFFTDSAMSLPLRILILGIYLIIAGVYLGRAFLNLRKGA
jgi:uncharacterized membrane protein HdeD (DUF308 family)